MTQIYVAEISVYIPGTGASTLYYASQSYVSKASDTPASTFYDGRIQQPANAQRNMFGNSRTYGATQIGFGELVLVNNDGELDPLIDYGFDGRAITIKLGTVNESDGGVATWTTVLKGTMEQAELTYDKLTIRVKDRQQELNIPLQRTKYAGTNSLPNGLEGVADLFGKPKPVCYGTVYNISPPCCNTSKLTFQVHVSTVVSIAVYDRGVALTLGTNHANSAALQAAAPGAGTYDTCLAEGYFRLGSLNAGTITADVVQGATAADRTVAQILKNMMLNAGIASGDITAGDVTALDTANAGVVGYWASHESEVPFISAMDEVANSIGAWYGVDRLGIFRMGRIVAPTGTEVTTLSTLEIIKIDRIASQDEGKGVPTWRTNLNYKKYYTVQDTDLAGAVTAVNRALLREQFRRVKSEDSSILTTHLLAPEMNFDTLLIDSTVAQTECDRRLAMYKVRKDRMEVRAYLNPDLAALLDVGVVIKITMPRFGFDAGKKFLVIGLRTDLRNEMVDLTLWG